MKNFNIGINYMSKVSKNITITAKNSLQLILDEYIFLFFYIKILFILNLN